MISKLYQASIMFDAAFELLNAVEEMDVVPFPSREALMLTRCVEDLCVLSHMITDMVLEEQKEDV